MQQTYTKLRQQIPLDETKNTFLNGGRAICPFKNTVLYVQKNHTLHLYNLKTNFHFAFPDGPVVDVQIPPNKNGKISLWIWGGSGNTKIQIWNLMTLKKTFELTDEEAFFTFGTFDLSGRFLEFPIQIGPSLKTKQILKKLGLLDPNITYHMEFLNAIRTSDILDINPEALQWLQEEDNCQQFLSGSRDHVDKFIDLVPRGISLAIEETKEFFFNSDSPQFRDQILKSVRKPFYIGSYFIVDTEEKKCFRIRGNGEILPGFKVTFSGGLTFYNDKNDPTYLGDLSSFDYLFPLAHKKNHHTSIIKEGKYYNCPSSWSEGALGSKTIFLFNLAHKFLQISELDIFRMPDGGEGSDSQEEESEEEPRGEFDSKEDLIVKKSELFSLESFQEPLISSDGQYLLNCETNPIHPKIEIYQLTSFETPFQKMAKKLFQEKFTSPDEDDRLMVEFGGTGAIGYYSKFILCAWSGLIPEYLAEHPNDPLKIPYSQDVFEALFQQLVEGKSEEEKTFDWEISQLREYLDIL